MGTALTTAQVRLERDGDIAVIVIDNPPINAGSAAVRSGLLAAIDTVAQDGVLQAAVIIGAGTTFIAGSDLKEFGQPLQDPQLPAVIAAIEACGKPVVAALHGAALGGGYELALGCDYRIAAPGTVVGLPEVTLGIIPGAGGTQRLPRLVGLPRAIDLICSGERVAASAALALGMLDAIASGDLRQEALACARRLIGARSLLRERAAPACTAEELAAASAAALRSRPRASRRAGRDRGRQPGGAGGHGARPRRRARHVPAIAPVGRGAGAAPPVLCRTGLDQASGAGRRGAAPGRADRGAGRRHHGRRHRDCRARCRLPGVAARAGPGRARTRRQQYRRPVRRPPQAWPLERRSRRPAAGQPGAQPRLESPGRGRPGDRSRVRGPGRQAAGICPPGRRHAPWRHPGKQYLLPRPRCNCRRHLAPGRCARPAFLQPRQRHAPARGGARRGHRARGAGHRPGRRPAPAQAAHPDRQRLRLYRQPRVRRLPAPVRIPARGGRVSGTGGRRARSLWLCHGAVRGGRYVRPRHRLAHAPEPGRHARSDAPAMSTLPTACAKPDAWDARPAPATIATRPAPGAASPIPWCAR